MPARRLPPARSRPPGTRWTRGVGCGIFIALAASGCGKKGPPLPPLVDVPDAVRQIAAQRTGDDVVLTLTLPAQNVDRSMPVNLARVEVYAYTGRAAPPPTLFTEVGTPVGGFETGEQPGATLTVRDMLTADELAEGRPLPRGPGAPAAQASQPAEDRRPLKRFYMAVPFSDRGRAGPPSPVAELTLTPLPDAPAELRTVYDGKAVALSWEPSGGLLGFLTDAAPLPPASPIDDGPPVAANATLPQGPTRYNVYREVTPAADPANAGGDETTRAEPAAVNPMPIEGFSFSDPQPSDGRRVCYAVSAVRGSRESVVEGRRSAPACITPVDEFPPSAPTGVSPIAVEGAISLVWEANTEPDLGGYLVWRGEDGADALVQITAQPVTDTRFTDSGVTPGTRYVYAVTAVDREVPPNVSAQSERVDVTAR